MTHATAPDGARIVYGTRSAPTSIRPQHPHARLPGHRRRRQARHPYSTELVAQDVIAVLDELGIDKVDVYGTSMGGRVAQQLAVRHGHRVGGRVHPPAGLAARLRAKP